VSGPEKRFPAMGPGGVNGGLALRETARAKRQWSPSGDGKVTATGSARGGHLSIEGALDQGSLGPVTRTWGKLILAGRGISSGRKLGGESWQATGVSEARSIRRRGWEDNAQRPADRSAEADLVA